MAIQKTKTLPNGTSGNYWKITFETCDKLSLSCTWKITLFLDKDHARDGQSLGLTKSFTTKVSKEDLLGNRTALGYAKIKAIAAAPSPSLVPTEGFGSPVPFDSDFVGGTDV